MLVIRLFRIGKKHQPAFKIVVTDKKNPPRGGRFVEQVGTYNPLSKQKTLKKDRVQYWLSVGAQPSNTVHNLLVHEGVLKAKKIDVHKKSKEKPAVEKVAAAKEEKPKAEEKPAPEKPKEEVKPEVEKAKEPKEKPAVEKPAAGKEGSK